MRIAYFYGRCIVLGAALAFVAVNAIYGTWI